MLKIGVLIKDLSFSQLNYEFIAETNKLYYPKWQPVDIIGFFESLSRICNQLFFSCMNIKEAWSFDGIMISTNLSNARKLIDFPSPKHKLFYVYDLEWMYLQHKSYEQLAHVFCNKELKVIAKSEQHAKILSSCWNINVLDIVPNFNMNRIKEICVQLDNQNGH